MKKLLRKLQWLLWYKWKPVKIQDYPVGKSKQPKFKAALLVQEPKLTTLSDIPRRNIYALPCLTESDLYDAQHGMTIRGHYYIQSGN